jgi:DNA-3-methyladenine glycosylase II
MSTSKSPEFWDQAKRELSKADPMMKKLIKAYGKEGMIGKEDAYQTLVRAIVGQQISVKAADAVWARIETGLGKVAPKRAQNHSIEQWRSYGLSGQKALYMTDLTRFFIERRHLERDWATMTDEEVIKDLIQIKGIGRWTAEMFLIFHLFRPDVLPLDDLGLIKAMWKFYNKGEKMSRPEMIELAEPWRPWRSVATWYLWRTYDIVAVNY